MYPTFRYQSPSEIPTFTLMVHNNTNHAIDFAPENIQAFLDGKVCTVYTLEQRVSEIRSAKRNKQIALAIVGGLAAGAAAYSASHSTVNYSNYGYVGRTSFYSAGQINVYDPMSGLFAGAAVGAVTGEGIRQIENAAGHEEQATQGIFQRSTIRPGTTVAGQIMLKVGSVAYNSLKVGVPVNGEVREFAFVKTDSPQAYLARMQSTTPSPSRALSPPNVTVAANATDGTSQYVSYTKNVRGARSLPPTTSPTQPVQMDSQEPSSVPRVVGASFGANTMGLSILQVDKNSVAARAGLQSGDLITQINGRNIAPLYWENAVALLTTAGTSVSVRLMGNEERILTFPQ
jgi:archaellum component FlaG (FlaF/FlaG flagellin family)